MRQGLARAMRRRCPNCGANGIFRGWWTMVDRCPHCDHLFEREEGYWVMAIIINTAVTEAVFAALFVVVLFATIPDVAWLPLLAVGLGANVIVPALFYPYSKTIWVAIDLHLHPSTNGN